MPDITHSIQLGLFNSQELVNSKLNTALIADKNDLTFKLAEETKVLGEFLVEELSKEFIENEALVLVLKTLEKWLEVRLNPAESFAAYVRFYDPNQRHSGPNAF